jgi:hypothetical protein
VHQLLPLELLLILQMVQLSALIVFHLSIIIQRRFHTYLRRYGRQFSTRLLLVIAILLREQLHRHVFGLQRRRGHPFKYCGLVNELVIVLLILLLRPPSQRDKEATEEAKHHC